MKKNATWPLLILGGGGIVIVDHLTKLWALSLKGSLPLPITSFFQIVLVYNRGISFGFFQAGAVAQVALLTLIALGITVGLVIWYMRSSSVTLRIGLMMIIGGALGNVLDRVLWGKVVDFLDFFLHAWHFPAFNFADACITCGTGLVFWAQMGEKSEKFS